MTVIKEVITEEFEGSFARIATLSPSKVWAFETPEAVTDESRINVEIIKGNVFINPKTKEEIVIGMSEKVQNLLGLPCDAWDTVNRNLECVRINLFHTELEKKEFAKRYNKIRNLNFFGRLRFLITGRVEDAQAN